MKRELFVKLVLILVHSYDYLESFGLQFFFFFFPFLFASFFFSIVGIFFNCLECFSN